MLKQFTVLLYLAGIVLSADLRNGRSTLLPISSVITTPPVKITRQIPYQDVPIEAQILRKMYAIPKIETSSNAQISTSSLYPIVNGNAGVISAVAPPVLKKEITIENQRQVTVHPPPTKQVSRIPVPVITQPLQQYSQTVRNPPAIQYIAVPVGYSHDYKNIDQGVHGSVAVQQTPNAVVTSNLSPSASVDYQPRVLYVSAPTKIVESPSIYSGKTKEGIVEARQSVTVHTSSTPPHTVLVSRKAPLPVYHRHEDLHTSSPIAQTSHGYETLSAEPSSGVFLMSPVSILSPSEQHGQPKVIPQNVQYILTPVRQVKKIFSNPVKAAIVENHQVVHPPPPAVAPNHNVQVIASTPTVEHDALFINHHGLPHVNYALSSSVAKPISIPVIHSAQHLPPAQLVGTSHQIQSSPAIVSQQVPVPVAQLIPVPVPYYRNSEAHASDAHKISTPVVYTKSVALEKDQASAHLVSTPVLQRAFSPATAVSRFSFRGHGINYGW